MLGEQLPPQAVREDHHLGDDPIERRIATPRLDLHPLLTVEALDPETEVCAKAWFGLAADSLALAAGGKRQAPQDRECRPLRQVGSCARVGETGLGEVLADLVVAQVVGDRHPLDL
jgi:hypothetical protein